MGFPFINAAQGAATYATHRSLNIDEKCSDVIPGILKEKQLSNRTDSRPSG